MANRVPSSSFPPAWRQPSKLNRMALFGGNITGRRLRGVKVNPIYQERDTSTRETDTQSESALPIGDITIQVYDSLPRSAGTSIHHHVGDGHDEGDCSGDDSDGADGEKARGRRARASGENRNDGDLPEGAGNEGRARGGRKGDGDTSPGGATAVDCLPWTYLQVRSSARREPVWGAFPGLLSPHGPQPPPAEGQEDLAGDLGALSLNHHDVGVNVLKTSGAGEPPGDHSASPPSYYYHHHHHYHPPSALQSRALQDFGEQKKSAPPGDDLPAPYLLPAPPYDDGKTAGGGYWDFVRLHGLKGAGEVVVVSPEDGHLLCTCPCHMTSSRDVITADCGPVAVGAAGGELSPKDQETGQSGVDGVTPGDKDVSDDVTSGNKDVSDDDSPASPGTDRTHPGSDPAVGSPLPSREGSPPRTGSCSHSSCPLPSTDRCDVSNCSVPGNGTEEFGRRVPTSTSDGDANSQPSVGGSSCACGDVVKVCAKRGSNCGDPPGRADGASTSDDPFDEGAKHEASTTSDSAPEPPSHAALSPDLYMPKPEEHEHSPQCVLDFQNNNNCRVRYVIRGHASPLSRSQDHRKASGSGADGYHIQRDSVTDRVSAAESPGAAEEEGDGSPATVQCGEREGVSLCANHGGHCGSDDSHACSEAEKDTAGQGCTAYSVDNCAGAKKGAVNQECSKDDADNCCDGKKHAVTQECSDYDISSGSAANDNVIEMYSDLKKHTVIEIYSDEKMDDLKTEKKGAVCKLCGCPSYPYVSDSLMSQQRLADDGMTSPYLYTPKDVTSLLSNDSILLRADKLDASSCLQRYLEEAQCHFLQQHERQLLYDDIITRLSLPPTPVKRPTAEMTSPQLIVPDTGERRDDADSMSYVEELTCQALARVTARSKSVKSNGTAAGFSRSSSKKSSHGNSHAGSSVWGTPNSIEDIEAEMEELWAQEGYVSGDGKRVEGAVSVVHVAGTSSDPAFEMIVPYEEVLQDTGYASRRRQRLEERADKEVLKDETPLRDRIVKAAVCSLLFCLFVAIFVGVAIHFGKQSIEQNKDDDRDTAASGYGYNR